MSFLSEIAEKKGEGWLQPISHADQILGRQQISRRAFGELVEACSRPEQLSLLAREFFRFSQQDPQGRSGYAVFVKEVDDSDFSLGDWIISVETVYLWLKDKNKTFDFLNILNYLNCCAQAPDNLHFHRHLKDIVSQMLDDYGIELATDLKEE